MASSPKIDGISQFHSSMTVAPNIATMKRMPNGLKNLHFLILLLFYVFTYADNRTGKIFYGAGKKNGRNFLRAVFRVDETVPHCFQMKR